MPPKRQRQEPNVCDKKRKPLPQNLQITGDGNCFYRAISLALYST